MRSWCARCIKVTFIYNFIMPSLLLNSVGIVILKLVSTYNVSMQSAGWLEAFKDGAILVGSFLLASFIPKMGYKRSLCIGIMLEIAASVWMACAPSSISYISAPIFFAMVGTAFALIKVSIYSSVKIITSDENQHASFFSLLEGFFIFGTLVTFWIFSFFMEYTGSWLYSYWLLAGLCGIGLVLIIGTPFDESALTNEVRGQSSAEGFKNMGRLFTNVAIILFLVLIFAYVFIEQGITTWLPTYDKMVFDIESSRSVQIAGLLSGGLALGRVAGGVLMQYVSWRKVLIGCIVMSFVLLLYSIYLSSIYVMPTHALTEWSQFPLAAYLIPVIGFFLGPIYPTLCSSILSSQPTKAQTSVTALIVIFSALGGTIGSRVVATFFGMFGGLTAIKVPIIPLLIILALLIPYHRRLKKAKGELVTPSKVKIKLQAAAEDLMDTDAVQVKA